MWTNSEIKTFRQSPVCQVVEDTDVWTLEFLFFEDVAMLAIVFSSNQVLRKLLTALLLMVVWCCFITGLEFDDFASVLVTLD